MSPHRFAVASTSAVVLGLAMTRCSLTTSLDGLSGAEPPDATDSSADAPRVEGGPTPDSSADGGVDGGVEGGTDGGVRFCASLVPAPMFCDDFDVDDSFARWAGMRLNAGGTVTRDPSAFASAPNSLLTSTPPSTTMHGAAALQLASNGTVRHVRYAFDLRVDARDPQAAYSEVSYIRFGGANQSYSFYMRLSDVSSGATFTMEAYLPDGGIPAHDLHVAGATFVDWMRVVIDLDLRTAPHFSVTVDGKLAGDTPLEPSFYTPAVATVETGIGYGGTPSSAGWKLRYDNVTVDFEP